MPSTTFTAVKQNAREQVLSTDLNRMQKIASREAQDLLMHGGYRDRFTSASSGAPVLMQAAEPVDRADDLGQINGVIGSFNITLQGGQAFMSIATSDPDQSSYCPVRWPGQTIATITPDVSTFRVDLIYATPSMHDTDSQSRNILVDPVARTVAPANVYKTSNPWAQISVLTGTPGSPTAPACPAGSIPLWEVVTTNVDVDSTAYRFIPRIWRRVESFAACHGILQNCVPQNGLNAETTSSVPYLGLGVTHKAIIDGELISAPMAGINVILAVDATGSSPTAVTIDANKDLPCYLYLCGGRHAPQNGAGTLWAAPLRLVASTIAPSNGRAASDLAIGGIAVPRGGTLYVGLAFISRGTHNYKSCLIDGDWIHARSCYVVGPVPSLPSSGFNNAASILTGASGTMDISVPPVSSVCDLAVTATDTAGARDIVIYGGAAAAVDFRAAQISVQAANGAAFAKFRYPIPTGGHFSWNGGAGTTSMNFCATGFNMGVPRIG
jgi:hypothetical protein